MELGTSADSGPTSQRNNRGRVYVVPKVVEGDAPDVVTNIFSIKAQPVDVLFDLGATYSFISVKLVEILGLFPTRKPPQLSMIFPDQKTVKCEKLYEDCPIRLYGHEFLVDLYKFELIDFGVILVMDWLAKYLAQTD